MDRHSYRGRWKVKGYEKKKFWGGILKFGKGYGERGTLGEGKTKLKSRTETMETLSTTNGKRRSVVGNRAGPSIQ